jgi:hypothetical protein
VRAAPSRTLHSYARFISRAVTNVKSAARRPRSALSVRRYRSIRPKACRGCGAIEREQRQRRGGFGIDREILSPRGTDPCTDERH